MGNEEKARKLTRDEKFAVQQMGRFWKDWMYLKESDVLHVAHQKGKP